MKLTVLLHADFETVIKLCDNPKTPFLSLVILRMITYFSVTNLASTHNLLKAFFNALLFFKIALLDVMLYM